MQSFAWVNRKGLKSQFDIKPMLNINTAQSSRKSYYFHDSTCKKFIFLSHKILKKKHKRYQTYNYGLGKR